jgi:hypothetical protein
MKRAEIQHWLRYWQAAKMVDVGEIKAFDQVSLARKWCSVMRTGSFSKELVSDLDIWHAICHMRSKQGGWRWSSARKVWQRESPAEIQCS